MPVFTEEKRRKQREYNENYLNKIRAGDGEKYKALLKVKNEKVIFKTRMKNLDKYIDFIEEQYDNLDKEQQERLKNVCLR